MPAAPLDLSTIIKAYDVRGLVGEQLDEGVAEAIGAAAAHVLGVSEASSGAGSSGAGRPRQLVVGHDMRDSSPSLVEAFARGVTRVGGDVLMIGLCSTDGLYYASGALAAPGAMFTASHNPAAYNGIKLCRAGAKPVGQETGLAEVRRLAQAELDAATGAGGAVTPGAAAGAVPSAGVHGSVTHRDLLREYAEHLRSLVDLSGIRPLTVVVDAGNGMAGHTAPAVLGLPGAAGPGGAAVPGGAAESTVALPALPLRVVPLYFELDGTFPNHEANPLEPENLRDLQAAVVEHGADLGLAFDGDADRCFVVDERGEPVSPSAVTALVALREVARALAAPSRRADDARPVVLHNLITSRAVPELVARAGADTVRTRVGHSYIKAEMARTGAVFGGEHSAHYYFADFWGADTGMLAAMHVLAALGEQSGPLSGLVAAYDPYAGSGEINSTVADAAAATAAVRETWTARGGVPDELDGLTVSSPPGESPSWWFNLRASNTEPLLRLNVEGADEPTMAGVRDAVLAQVRGARS